MRSRKSLGPTRWSRGRALRRLLVAFLVILPTAAVAAEPVGPVDLAIVVSLDRSESIDADDAKAQIHGLIYALRHPRLRNAVAAGPYGRIGLSVVTWSSFGRHQVILPWMQVASGTDAELAAEILDLDFDRQRIARHGTQTDVAFAIEVGLQQLEHLPWAASQQVINVVADGISNIGRVASVDRDLALARGVTVNGLIMARGSAIEVMTRYFRREVIGGSSSFVQVSSSPQDFAVAMLRKMLLEIVRLREPPPAALQEASLRETLRTAGAP